MPGHERKSARLRTKTGCLTCRARRKKCGEELPTCNRCYTSRRCCRWPSSDELVDRRSTSKRAEQALPPIVSTKIIELLDDIDDSSHQNYESRLSVCGHLSTLSEAVSTQIIRRDVEPILASHFASTYFRTILLPDCHDDFFHGWIADIQKFMTQHKSVYYSVLACSASQIHELSNVRQMRELAIGYYSRSIKEVSRMLDTSSVANRDCLLNCVILLYLHGCLGLATFDDIPRHLNAAIRLLRIRFFDTHHETIIYRPFDRIAVESVLYQIFITTMGSWCTPPSDFRFDPEFWLQAEALLSRNIPFPKRSISFNSPVLGTPLPLLRLVLSVKQLSQSPFVHNEEIVMQLSQGLRQWEHLIWGDNGPMANYFDSEMPHYSIYRDVSILYILIVSRLLEQVTEEEKSKMVSTLHPKPSNSWQTFEMRQILQRHIDDEDWTHCFIGCWPVYTVGFFMDSAADQHLVRSDLHRRWKSTGSSQMSRFLEELELAWISRDILMGSRVTYIE